MIITQTPLRISLAGGGTDIPSYYETRGGGHVVSAAINRYVTVIITARYDDKIYVHWSSGREVVDAVKEIQHELVRETLRLTGIKGGVEIVTLSDIPAEGSGLGSSSSVTVGLLNACHIYQNDPVGPGQLAEEACEIEINRCGKPIGKQDQYIAAYGGVCSLGFQQGGQVIVERMDLSNRDIQALSANLFLFDTQSSRSADSILAAQGKNAPANGAHLDAIRDLAEEAYAALYKGHCDQIGMILGRSWSLKKRLADVISNSTIDYMYDRAINAGALGGKVCGAGGGGFLLVYCRPEQQAALLTALLAYPVKRFGIERAGSRVTHNDGRDAWK